MNGEVLVPAGSLDHALWALAGGADAVYFGYQKFSARSHAENFQLEDVALLTREARAKKAKVYCALNTILVPEEVADAVVLAWELYWNGVDALIVQDLGLAQALKLHGPPLDLHASTQTAVHNPGGARALQAMGFRRVILARELTMAEIGEIIRAVPEMEFEVFVHGALCYAVSGQCMASGLMIGRSANRGDCGQVCRTKFELDYLIPGPQRRESPHEAGLPTGIHAPPGEDLWKSGAVGAFASMNDLELGARVRELAALGVSSFKIEGRMKPPAYSYNTALAYKAFLQGSNDDQAWKWLDEARLRHGRLPSAGWFDGHKALSQTNSAWAGTLGLPLGTVTAQEGSNLLITLPTRSWLHNSLSKGDGILIIAAQSGQTYRGPLADKTRLQGTKLRLKLGGSVGFDPRDATVWLTSRHDGKLPIKRAGRPTRFAVPLKVQLTSAHEGTVHFEISTTEFGGLVWTHDLPAELAQGSKSLEAALPEIFRASNSRFEPSELLVDNQIGPWFITPKNLKEMRRLWYAALEARSRQFLQTIRQNTLKGPEQPNKKAPPRGDLSPQSGVNQRVGFVVDWESLTAAQLSPTPWGLALPLAPFTPDEESYLVRLRAFLERTLQADPGVKIFLGLGNPAHLSWLARLRREGWVLDSWFADWAFHSANAWTSFSLSRAEPGLAFCIPWLEDTPLPDVSYQPPLFTSRACMLRNSFNEPHLVPQKSQSFDSRQWIAAKLSGAPLHRPDAGPHCPDGCSGHFSARLVQGKTGFRVEARDCVNYLLLEKEPAASR